MTVLSYLTRTAVLSAGIALSLAAVPAAAATLYENGFEADTAGWNVFGGALDATRVASGTNGIASASGGFHAESETAAGNWGGYGFNPGCTATACAATPFQEYKTSVDIFLDVGGGWGDNTRFDFDSAVSASDGSFLRDFIFNGAFFSEMDIDGPGAGTDRFVISASNNSQPGSAYAKNPGRMPIAIDATGWYTFMHRFYEDGGALAVDMTIMNDSDMTVGSWTLSNPADTIPGVAGGNRYGWFDYNEFDVLAFDNAKLESAASVPEPSSLALLAGAVVLAGASLRRRRS